MKLAILSTNEELFIVFNTFKINSLSEGNSTVRLLERRWSGHLKVWKTI